MLESFDRTSTFEQRWGYCILRAFMGLCFWAHAVLIVCFGKGLAALASHMLFSLAETQLPQNLILLFGYSLPFLDFAIGTLLIVGFATGPAIAGAFVYLCALTINFALDTDYPALLVSIGVALALAFLMVGRKRFDAPWHHLILPREEKA